MKIATALFFLLTCSLNAQWKWINPYPNGEDFNSVCFVSPKIGWIAASGGKLLKTTDGGNSWSEKAITNSLVTINDISFIDESYGIAVGVSKFTGGGSGGVILKTTDGGENWETHYCETEEVIAVSFYSNLIGYAVGNSAIFTTSDGGISWKFQPIESFYPTDVLAINQNTAIAIGLNHAILRTTNGGNEWTNVNYPYSLYPYSLCNADSGSIIAVGAQGTIIKSRDSGLTWEKIESNTATSLLNINFLTPQDGVILGEKGVILITNNGGSSWQLKNSLGSNNLKKICLADKKNIIAVGPHGLRASSQDGGVHWSGDYKPLLPEDYFFDGLYLNENSILVAGRGGIYKSTDKGNSWTIKNINHPGYLYKLHFSDSKYGLAIGSDYAYNNNSSFLLRTSDGGDTWTQVKTDSAAYKNISYIKNSGTAFMILEKDYSRSLYKSVDHGVSWSLVNNNFIPYMIHFFDESFGLANAGYYGIYKTTDGGISWENLNAPFMEGANYMSFSENGYGILATHEDGYMITADYGETWKTYGDNLGNHILGVSMTGNGVLTIARGCHNPGPIGGLIQFSTDAGYSWRFYQSRNDFTAVNFLDENTGLVIGTNSSILSFCADKFSPSEISDNISVEPKEFSLSQCYPNPFNPSTKIDYSIQNDGPVSLIVYDFLGRKVAKLIDEFKSKGSYTLDYKPSGLPSGVYFYRLKSGNYSITKKMILLK